MKAFFHRRKYNGNKRRFISKKMQTGKIIFGIPYYKL